jgi:hypothetical protein
MRTYWWSVEKSVTLGIAEAVGEPAQAKYRRSICLITINKNEYIINLLGLRVSG